MKGYFSNEVTSKCYLWKSFKTFTWFFHCRKQQAVLNGQDSTWENINAGFLQGSLLVPLLSSNLH